MADIAKINGLNLKDAAARADIATAKTDIATAKTDIATAKTDIASLKNNLITEISSSYIRITNYPTGVYKLTYNGTKYIYYYGEGGSQTIQVKAASGSVMLTINQHSTNYWTWYYITSDSGISYLCYGYCTTASGMYRTMALPTAVNGTLATTALATTSVSGLMSSADKTKLNGLKSAGEWTVANVTSNYWKYSYSSSTAQAKGQINAYINSTTKMAYLTGNIYINGTATTDYSIIPVARLKSLISGFTGIDMPTQIIGQSWFYYQSTLDTSKTDYGGYIKYNQNNDALEFGRFYTQSMDSHGNWAFQPLNNVAIQFIAYVKMK